MVSRLLRRKRRDVFLRRSLVMILMAIVLEAVEDTKYIKKLFFQMARV